MSRLRVVAAVVAAVASLGACGGDGDRDESRLPVVGQIEPAIDAVEAELGGPQSYFEINATALLVNLFVATDDGSAVVPYVYVDGEVQPPAPVGVASGATFTADDLAELDDDVFGRITDELAEPTIAQFVITATAGGTPRYDVLVVSDRGGTLAVSVEPDGSILSVDPL